LESLHNSRNYFERLRKKLLAMIQQFDLPMFFIIFTYVEDYGILSLKVLHTLHVSKLNLPNKIKDFESVHIVELI
jgi:hypothetical protein